LLSLGALLAAGCSGGKSENPSTTGTPPAPAPSTPPPPSPPSEIPAVSQYDSGPRAAESPVDETLAKQGEKLFTTKGCAVCHAFGKKVTGPDLAGVTHRRTKEWIEHQILHPEVMTKTDPIAHELLLKHTIQMPNQKLTEDEARAVIEFFKRKDKEAGEKKPPS
jgi:cytochrome c551/c552